MFERATLKELTDWKTEPNRKPLVLRGARQVGKTTVVNKFARQFEQYIYLNLKLPVGAVFGLVCRAIIGELKLVKS